MQVQLRMSERLLIAEALNVHIQQYHSLISNPDIQVNAEVMTQQKRKLERIRDKMLVKKCECCFDKPAEPGFKVCLDCTVEAVDDMVAGRY
jgi:hypothetical protein